MPKQYRRKGKDAFLDPIRGVLVEKRPEEEVRQRFLVDLVQRYDVPPAAIRVEYALSKSGVRSRKRADIVLMGEGDRALMVIECKQPGTPLHDGVHAQAVAYANALGSPYVALVNGIDLRIMHRREGRWLPLMAFPKFAQLHRAVGLRYTLPESRTFAPLSTAQLGDHEFLRCHEAERSRDWRGAVLGRDTPWDLWTPIYALCSAISYEPDVERCLPFEHGEFRVEEYLGNHFLEFGNYSGGRFPGLYSSYLVRDRSGDHQIYRIAFFACGSFFNDPKYGTRRGTSGIHVIIDDFDSTPHSSLELCLDRCLIRGQGAYELVHDGSITVGRLGAAKRDAMLGHVKALAPDLLRDVTTRNGRRKAEVVLGRFPGDIALSFSDIAPLVFNLLRYSEARDRFRDDYKRRHASMVNVPSRASS